MAKQFDAWFGLKIKLIKFVLQCGVVGYVSAPAAAGGGKIHKLNIC